MAGQEAILAAAGLPRSASSLGSPDSSLPQLIELLNDGNERALAAVRDAGALLGIALSDISNVIDPDTIVLGGNYADLTPWLAQPLEDALANQVMLLPNDARSSSTARRSVPTQPVPRCCCLDHRARPRPARDGRLLLTEAGDRSIVDLWNCSSAMWPWPRLAEHGRGGAGEGRAVFADGEPGIGKPTRSIDSSRARTGARVLLGTCGDLSNSTAAGSNPRSRRTSRRPLEERSAAVPRHEIQTC